MKHLRIFNSAAEFEAAKPNLDELFVVLNEENGGMVYSNLPTISEDDLTEDDYVDLGLPSGLLWATRNIGAEKPCDYGKYFQWGATVGYTTEAEANANSSWETAPFNGGKSKYNEDVFAAVSGTACPNGVLAAEYDAAYQATNGAYRMPTSGECQELIDNTNHTWCTCEILGHSDHTFVNGCLFTSKTDETKKLFIPAAGHFSNGSFEKGGSYGYVWSSSLYSSYPYSARNLYFYSSDMRDSNSIRSFCQSVRGVKNKA